MRNHNLKLVLAVVCGVTLGLAGCNGDTDGGKAADQNFHDTPFVPNEDNSGSINLDVNEEELNVADTTGFRVFVKDAAGQAVDGVTIACDSELGVAILEPTTGAEITDSFGQISGRIGCATPGSYLFGCRLPVGGNLRQFVTIRCGGAIPTGFSGFAGAAGGGLGTGGSDTSDDGGVGGVDNGSLRITNVVVDDSGSGGDGVQVDTVFTQDCDNVATTITPETFGDTFAKITVVNNTNSTIKFTSLKVNVPGVGTSSSIAFLGDAAEVAGEGDTATLTALVFSVVGPGGGDKYLIRGSKANNLPIGAIGVKNVTFSLTGTTGQGETVTVRGTTALSFAGYNNCG
jgi:hypothetical protein